MKRSIFIATTTAAAAIVLPTLPTAVATAADDDHWSDVHGSQYLLAQSLVAWREVGDTFTCIKNRYGPAGVIHTRRYDGILEDPQITYRYVDFKQFDPEKNLDVVRWVTAYGYTYHYLIYVPFTGVTVLREPTTTT